MSATAELINPIEMEVFSNRLLSITEDMGNALIRGSFSTNIKERRDCSVAVFDGRGRLTAQASHIPMHLGSLKGGVDAVLCNYAPESIRPGDAFICNDSYMAGGTHAPDITIVTPVFWNGSVEFYAANIGHHADVGGSFPGSSSPLARTVFEEGIRIPVIRIVSQGEIDGDLLRLIVHNTREPEDRELDLRVQIATNDKGAALLHELVRQSGIERVRRSIDDLLEYTGQRLRRRLSAVPDGQASFTTFLDDDGLGGEPVPITATVEIRGDRLRVDFEGSGPQARGALNVPRSALEASVYAAVKTMLDPDLLPNEGMFQPVEISAPPGSIVNPVFPGAVNLRAATSQKISGAVVGAFAGLLERDGQMASSNDCIPAMVFYGERRGRDGKFVYFETIGGGAGGRPDGDGMDGVHVHITNTSNLPVEALENEYPLMVDEYGLIPDSGGAGEHRGGLGIARQIRSLQPDMFCHIAADSTRRGAAGLHGGRPGGLSRIVFDHGDPGEREADGNTIAVQMAEGRSIRLETAGGGGFGDPAARPVTELRADLASGKLTRERAAADYGADRVAAALAAPLD